MNRFEDKIKHRIDLLKVHLSTAFFGTSGLMGKGLAMSSMTISLMRGLFSAIFLFFVLKIKKENMRIDSRKDWILMIAAAFFLAANWVTFVYSIQISSVAIGTLTCAAGPLFLTFVEPVIFKEKLKGSSVLAAVIMIAGLVLICPSFDAGDKGTQGLLWGILAAIVYAIFTLINRDLIERYSGEKIAFYQHSIVTIMLLPTLLITGVNFTLGELGILILCGVFVTALPHVLYISGQRSVSAQTGGVIAGMESVYGIILAIIFFNEMPDVKTVAGGVIILVAAAYSSISGGDHSKSKVKDYQ